MKNRKASAGRAYRRTVKKCADSVEKIKKDRFRTCLFVAVLITVGVIWLNSALPVPVSKAQSNMTESIIERVVPTETPFLEYIVGNIRKSAHVIEYGLLGIMVSLIFLVFPNRNKAHGENGFCGLTFQKFWNMISVPLAVAVTDESIQILSGRGPLITDVLIDMLGASCTIALVTAVYIFIRKLKKHRYPSPKLIKS